MTVDEILKRDDVITGRQLADREAACPPMPLALDRLWRFLSTHCKGRDRVMKTEDLAVRLGILTRDKQGRSVGDGKQIVHLASKLVNDYLKPVASVCTGKRRGMYVIATREEKEIEKARCRHRRIALTRREIAIERAPIEKRPPIQVKLWD